MCANSLKFSLKTTIISYICQRKTEIWLLFTLHNHQAWKPINSHAKNKTEIKMLIQSNKKIIIINICKSAQRSFFLCVINWLHVHLFWWSINNSLDICWYLLLGGWALSVNFSFTLPFFSVACLHLDHLWARFDVVLN